MESAVPMTGVPLADASAPEAESRILPTKTVETPGSEPFLSALSALMEQLVPPGPTTTLATLPPQTGEDLPLDRLPTDQHLPVGLATPTILAGLGTGPGTPFSPVDLLRQLGSEVGGSNLKQARPMGADTTRPGQGTLLTPVSIERPSPGIASGADALPASDVTILRLFEEAGQELPAKALQRLANGITEASATILSSGSRADAGAQALVLTAGSASLPSMTGNTLSSAMPATLSHVDVPLNQPGWDQALGDKVLWLVNRQMQGAELRLNPPQLGPLEVRIAVDQDQARVLFMSQNVAVREAVEAALPRLREMLGASGFDQIDVNVSQHSLDQPGQHPRYTNNDRIPWPTLGHEDAIERASRANGLLSSPIGLVDYYV